MNADCECNQTDHPLHLTILKSNPKSSGGEGGLNPRRPLSPPVFETGTKPLCDLSLKVEWETG